MKLNTTTETELISLVEKKLGQKKTGENPMVLGMGDDCAFFNTNQNELLALSKDLFIEGVHFLKSASSAYDIGYKALAVNVSDLAAKGAEPKSYMLGLSLPGDLELSWFKEFLDGMYECAEKWNLTVCGGDTTASDGPISVSITIFGTIPHERLKLRAHARPGHGVFVTGYLGDSAAGLDLILREKDAPGAEYFKFRHFHPIPQVREGVWLSQQPGVGAMMDVSDGLLLDLPKLCQASKVGADIDLNQLPISPALIDGAHHMGWDPLQWALSGGEDYVLLLTIDEANASQIMAAFKERFEVPLTQIGQITSNPTQINWTLKGEPYALKKQPFEHFRP